MMGNLLFLTTAGKGGVSLNPDLIETNLLNLTLVLVFVFVFGRKVLTNILTERREAIETAIKDTEDRQKTEEHDAPVPETVAEPTSAPAIQPIMVGSDAASPAERKRGWWRRF